MLGFCLPGCGGKYIPSNYLDLTREEVKELFASCIATNNGRLIVHGLFARANVENVNKRIYPKDLLQREVSRFKHDFIQSGIAIGEMEHPSYSSLFYKCINLPNISHQVLELSWKGNELWGTIEVLPTPSGLLVWELYARGVKLGVSSRGWATLRTDPNTRRVYVDKDYELITFDFVVEPSTRDAYVVPIFKHYRKPIPDQRKMVGIAHLGYGAVLPEKVGRLPEARVLMQRVSEIRNFHARGLASDSRQLPASPLDNVLLYSHYLVHTADSFLQKEQHIRSFEHHLALITTKVLVAQGPRPSRSHQRNSSQANRPTVAPAAKPEPGVVAATAAAAAAAVAVAASASAGAAGEPLFRRVNIAPDAAHNEQTAAQAAISPARDEIAQEVKVSLEAYLARLEQARRQLSEAIR